VVAGTGAGDEAAALEKESTRAVVKVLVFEGFVGTDIAFATDRLGRQAAGGPYILVKAESSGVDAEEIGGGILDEGFGIDGPGEMHV